ncbi:MAG TPA: murein biosynthesis integral membrane protein MurJ, partial [Opitutaceae bacterium]|nr:murein biosynthesis integral membrane protein MurJ [Opitutaceae bacterium]
MSKNLKNISLVSALTLVSRVLGLVRDSLTAAVFGTSALASAFITAYTLPNLFRRLLGEGALTAAFVPTLHDELSQRQRDGAFRLISQVSSWLFLITSAIVALAIGGLMIVAASARQGAFALATDTVERWIQAAELAIWLFPYLIFVCLAAAYSAALQTLQRFLEPALSPIWLNYAIIACLSGSVVFDWGDGDLGRMHWLCVGVLIGGALQMIVPGLTLVRMGWKPRFDLQLSPQVRAIARLMAPTVFGSAIYLINMAVSRLLGLSLDDASATLLNLAGRLMELPIGLFAVAVTTVIFPLISRYAATGDWAGMASSYRKGMRLILVLNIPAAAGLALLATPIVRLLFQHGEFTAQDTQAMMPVLAVYALGLPFFSFVSLTLRAFYAQKDTVTPVQAALVSFVLNLALSFALMKPFGTLGLALAGNLAVVVQAIHLQRKLSAKRAEMAFAPLAKDLLKIVMATAVMAAVVLLSLTALNTILATSFLDDILRIGGVIAA